MTPVLPIYPVFTLPAAGMAELMGSKVGACPILSRSKYHTCMAKAHGMEQLRSSECAS